MSRVYEAMIKAKRTRGEDTGPSSRLVNFSGDSGLSREVTFAKAGMETPRLEGLLEQVMDPDEVWFEQFRILRERLRILGEKEKVCNLGLVSAAGGEGKTTVAVALSLILAREPGTRVLLVDADLRKPDVDRYLGLKEGAGLADWLADPKQNVPLRRLESFGTFVLTAGGLSKRPWELIASPWLDALLTAARRDFDLVVVDCPPQGPIADTARIQDYLDGLLLVVRARSAPREAILSTVEQLRQDKLLGTVLNRSRRLSSHYYNYGPTHYKNR